MNIQTDRLILREPKVSDTEDYLQFCNSEFVLRYNAMTPKGREAVQEQFSRQSNQESILLQLKEDGKVVGYIGIEDDSLRYGVASKELSYFIHERYSRQGYMKEALHAVIAHLFETEKLECVAARCFAPNTASRALLRSLGFQQDGTIPRCVKGYKDEIFDDTHHSLFRKDFI